MWRFRVAMAGAARLRPGGSAPALRRLAAAIAGGSGWPVGAAWAMVRRRGAAGPPGCIGTQPQPTAMTDSKQQRINMVESQVRPSDVTDRRIIRAMLEVPREAFVPRSLQALAYMDEAVPVTSRRPAGPLPAGAAHLCQARAARRDRSGRRCAGCGLRHGLLHGGAGTARQAVVAVEVDAALAARATQTLRQLGVDNAW